VAFELGCETAALTHDHPSGILSAGFLALLIAELVARSSPQDAIRAAKAELVRHPKRQEVLAAVEDAETLAVCLVTWPIPASLGQGWIAEEALAIALYCALAAPNFEEAPCSDGESFRRQRQHGRNHRQHLWRFVWLRRDPGPLARSGFVSESIHR
jgi:hypothetical protein